MPWSYCGSSSLLSSLSLWVLLPHDIHALWQRCRFFRSLSPDTGSGLSCPESCFGSRLGRPSREDKADSGPFLRGFGVGGLWSIMDASGAAEETPAILSMEGW